MLCATLNDPWLWNRAFVLAGEVRKKIVEAVAEVEDYGRFGGMIDLLMSRARLNASYACIRVRNGLDLPKAAIGTLKVVPKISGSVRDLVDAEDKIGGRGETLRPVRFLHGVHHHQGRGTRSRGSWLLRDGLLGVCGWALGRISCQVECERHSCRCWARC